MSFVAGCSELIENSGPAFHHDWTLKEMPINTTKCLFLEAVICRRVQISGAIMGRCV